MQKILRVYSYLVRFPEVWPKARMLRDTFLQPVSCDVLDSVIPAHFQVRLWSRRTKAIFLNNSSKKTCSNKSRIHLAGSSPSSTDSPGYKIHEWGCKQITSQRNMANRTADAMGKPRRDSCFSQRPRFEFNTSNAPVVRKLLHRVEIMLFTKNTIEPRPENELLARHTNLTRTDLTLNIYS